MSYAVFLASALIVVPPKAPAPDAGEKYLAACTTKAKHETAACQALAAEVNRRAVRYLLASQIARLEVDKNLLRDAARSRDGALRSIGIRMLSQHDLDDADRTLVLAGLDSPFPGVRREAMRYAREYGDDAVRKRLERGRGEEWQAAFPSLADEIPDAKKLGGAVYTGATYDYLSSDRERAFFMTPDSVEKVVAFYKRAGKKAQTIAEIERARSAPSQPDPAEMMRRIQAGEDPQKIVAEMQAKSMGGASQELVASVKKMKGVEDARVIELSGAVAKMGTVPQQARHVVVYKDSHAGKTGLFFPIPKSETGAVMLQADFDADQMVWSMEALAIPLPTTPGTDPTQ